MLVLTRKSEQKIVIGNRNKIVITVLKVQGGIVQLGLDADPEIPIHRAELLEEIEKANTGGAVSQEMVDVKGVAQKLKIKPHKRRQQPSETSSQ
jgi:carbon storage regulator